MKYSEMKFVEFREHSAGYQAIFDNGYPRGYGIEASINATESMIENDKDSLGDRDTRICRAADGKLYRVCGNEHTAVKCWEEVELIKDRAERIRDFRDYSVGTLQAAQEKSGVLAQNISKFETGARDIAKASGETLMKISKAYGVTIEELIK